MSHVLLATFSMFFQKFANYKGKLVNSYFPPKCLGGAFQGEFHGETQLFLRFSISPRETASKAWKRETQLPGSSWKVLWSFSPGGHTGDLSHKANGGGHAGICWYFPHIDYITPSGPPGEKQFWLWQLTPVVAASRSWSKIQYCFDKDREMWTEAVEIWIPPLLGGGI